MTEKTKKWLRPALAVAGGLLLAAAVLLALHLWPQAPQPALPSASSQPVVSTPPPPLPDNPIDFAALWEESPDAVGWIRVPGTVIDYAVMRSGEDREEDFYLHHDTDGRYKFAGSIYMQRVNSSDFSDTNTLLYGHNMKNGSMFAAVHKFKKADFFNEHRTLYIYIPGHILTYEIYSLFVYDDRLIPGYFDFTDPADVSTYQQMTLAPHSGTKQVRQGVTLTPEDRLVTLSTCTNNEGERLLLHAVLVEDTPTN